MTDRPLPHPDTLERELPDNTEPNLLERQPDSHGIHPRWCTRCGADATNYMVCPACFCRDLDPDAGPPGTGLGS